MSGEGSRTIVEPLFPFQVRKPGHSVGARESYDLNLLGFVDEVPMLEPSAANEIATLQGKQVIVKTNCMSGEKSLIFKQKTGQNLEIPARRCSFVKPEVNVETAGHSLQVVKAPVAVAVAVEVEVPPRHKPTILKRKDRLHYQIIANKLDCVSTLDVKKVNVTGCARPTVVATDHDYSVRDAIDANSKSLLDDQYAPVLVVDITDAAATNCVKVVPQPNTQLYRTMQFSSENGNLMEVKDLSKYNSQMRAYPPAKNILKRVDRSCQTFTLKPVMKTAGTNTDDSLLQEYITSRIQEKAVQLPIPVSVEFNSPKPSRVSLADACIGMDRVLSPLSLMGDSDLLMDLCNFDSDANLRQPIIGQNANFGTGPVMSGKCVDSVGKSVDNYQLLDITNSRGKNVGNWAMPFHNSGLNGGAGIGRMEAWKVQFFLDLKHSDQFDSYGNMPLHVAVMENNLNRVRKQCFALRIRNIDIDTLNHGSMTALQLAVLHDANLAILQTLIKHNASTTILDGEGNTLLHLAVIHSSDAVVQMLLGTCPTLPVDASNFEGDTALILAVVHEKYVKVDRILQAGANPNIGDKKSGRTPLFHAVEANNVEMVKILLNHKAQTKVRNFFGTSPHDAIFELDSVDKTIRKLVLNKDYIPYKQRSQSKERKKRKTPEQRSPPAKVMKLKTDRVLEKVRPKTY